MFNYIQISLEYDVSGELFDKIHMVHFSTKPFYQT